MTIAAQTLQQVPGGVYEDGTTLTAPDRGFPLHAFRIQADREGSGYSGSQRRKLPSLPVTSQGTEPLAHREITVHFDGSCLPAPRAPPGTLHPGGYAAVLVNDLTGIQKNLFGPVPDTTNNRAELTAAIKALDYIRPGAIVTMVGDSQLVIKGMTEWRFGWKRKSWRGSDNKQVKNLDLWLQLIELSQKPAKLEWVWARGNAGNVLNEEADRLARSEAEKLKRRLSPASR